VLEKHMLNAPNLTQVLTAIACVAPSAAAVPLARLLLGCGTFPMIPFTHLGLLLLGPKAAGDTGSRPPPGELDADGQVDDKGL
jgi:hypothetical protein